MGLFSKKGNEIMKDEVKKEFNIQECFKKNLAFISQIEIDAEVIKRQFVKSDRNFFLTVGTIDCPTGNIVVADPLCYLVAGKYCPQMSMTIPAGSYPVDVSIYRNSMIGLRMCTAKLRIKDRVAIRYVNAESTKETAIEKCEDGNLSGFPVEAGMMTFCDVTVADAYRSFIDHWYVENEGKNHYNDYFAHFFAKSAKAMPAYQGEEGDFIEWKNPDTGHRMVMIASGFGDGLYHAFWGYDEDDEICELIVPLVNPELFE